MKDEFKSKGGLAHPALAQALVNAGRRQGRKERVERLNVFVLFAIAQNAMQSFFADLRPRGKTAFVFGLGVVLAVFCGCATGARVIEQPGTTGPSQKPSVARIEGGRHGFVIRENPNMDAASRDEFERAVDMINDGKNDKAIELLTKVIERSPGVTAPYINIAEAYMRMGKPEPAEQHLKTALSLVPDHPVASNEYGLLLRKAGRFKEAREIYEKALESFPAYLPLHRNLGILCDLYLNDPECALKQFEIYSEGTPEDAKVKIWIAELRMRLGKN